MSAPTKQTYDEWMAAVDAAVRKIADVSVHDLPDWNSRDAYDDGVTPQEAAEDVLDQEGWDY